MKLFKSILFFSALVFFQNIFSNICVYTTADYKMFANLVTENMEDQAFILAFKDAHFKNYSTAQLVNQLENIKKENCSVSLGLCTNQECLTAGPILQKNKTILLSHCSDDHIARFYPYLYTGAPKLSSFAKRIAAYTNHSHRTTFVFYEPSDISSYFEYNDFKQYAKKNFFGVPVSLYGKLDVSIIKQNIDKKLTFVFFIYPLPASQILISLDSNHLISKKINMIGSTSWRWGLKSETFKPLLSIFKKADSVLTPNIVPNGYVNSSSFSKRIKEIYRQKKLNKENPLFVDKINYDTTRFATQCYQTVLKRGNYNNSLFLDCLKNNKYKGVFGSLYFEKNLPFASRKVSLTQLKF